MASEYDSNQIFERTSPLRFHQRFTVPATEHHEILKISYGVCGPPLGEDVMTILFCGGMFGSRWQGVTLDHLARKMGVRVLFIDRPGFGGSTEVLLSQRIPIFLETVPLLLQHLKITHVHLASHSAGAIYALNLLHTHPSLLSPQNPTITLFAPWVHQSHTGVSFLQVASLLPNGLLNHWNTLTGFMINSATPAFSASSGALSSFSAPFTSLFASKPTVDDDAKEEKQSQEVFGIGVEARRELEKLIMKYAFAETNTGANEEARLCLKSVAGSCSWHACEDYPTMVANLAKSWDEKVAKGENGLKVRAFFAAGDMMIGVKGKKYWGECWKAENIGKGIEVELVGTEGTDHDSFVDPGKGYMGKMMSGVMEARS
ncbi:Alpha/Beta hydrolase protein [Amylocarpus encephaloides]|uniref:Alpha/Beta hydrolase protein n=1 Tax=Amylocarpus encephaloides TaxID=45428 RepID=A0A9P7YA71_9HELO|nr:Alpha/Beta hydrolase protein [Amylocarpus encephaloides]